MSCAALSCLRLAPDVFPHVSLFQFLQVFDCKGFMSHVSHSAAFGLGQMCFKMFCNKRGDSFRSARAPALVRLGREGR